MHIYIYMCIFGSGLCPWSCTCIYIYIVQDFVLGVSNLYIYTSVQSPTLSSLEKRPQNLDICADTGIGICFSLHLCVVFLFLVWYSHPSFRLPPAASFNLSSTSSSHTAYSSKHNLLTHTQLVQDNFPIHDLACGPKTVPVKRTFLNIAIVGWRGVGWGGMLTFLALRT